MLDVLAQNLKIQTGDKSDVSITGPLSKDIKGLADIINIILSFLIPFAALMLFFVFVAAGYDFLFSQGNPEKIKSAQAKITTGIIGFVFLTLSYFLVRATALIFGVKL